VLGFFDEKNRPGLGQSGQQVLGALINEVPAEMGEHDNCKLRRHEALAVQKVVTLGMLVLGDEPLPLPGAAVLLQQARVNLGSFQDFRALFAARPIWVCDYSRAGLHASLIV
jgi:hypothetical protein